MVLFTLTALLVLAALVLLWGRWGKGGALISTGSLLSKPLSAPHAHLDSEQHCQDCHVVGSQVAEELCLKCHKSLQRRIAAKSGFHAKVQAKCWDCHSEHHERDYELIKWPAADAAFQAPRGKHEAKEFPHEPATGFALAGAHQPLGCEGCHKTELLRDAEVVAFKTEPKQKPKDGPTSWGLPTYLGLGTSCGACHQDPHVPSQGDDCKQCHGEERWKPSPSFDHQKTRFPLEGKHQEPAVAQKCEGCHLEPAPKQPPPLGEPPLPTFRPVAAKAAPRRFRGVGFGAAPAEPVRGEALPGCAACHENVHRKQSKMFGDCESCHTADAWAMAPQARFDHGATGFRLEGGHRDVKCAECHGGKTLNGPVKQTCVECHRKDDQKVHKGAFDREMTLKGKSCELCHDVKDWKRDTYSREEHLRATEVALIDKHGGKCEVCHAAGATISRLGQQVTIPRLPPEPGGRVRTGPLERACDACHGDPHEGKFQRELQKGCVECHDYKQWHLAQLDAAGHAKIGFPIRDAHADPKIKCEDCHGGRSAEGGLRKLSLTEVRVQGCVVCHEDPHVRQLGQKCADCHGEQVFTPSTYTEARHQQTRLPLRDAHRAVPCEVCHVRNITVKDKPQKAQRFKWPGREVACERCHEDPHAGQFKSQGCGSCHGESHFVPSTFEVKAGHRRIGFPLDGPHDADCARCHVSGLSHGAAVTYKGTPQQCGGCHLDVHLGQFEQKRLGCQTCHVLSDWKPSRFDHAKCRFPLQGAHERVACAECHLAYPRKFPDGVQRKVVTYYPIEARDCGDCHQNPHARAELEKKAKQARQAQKTGKEKTGKEGKK